MELLANQRNNFTAEERRGGTTSAYTSANNTMDSAGIRVSASSSQARRFRLVPPTK